MSTDNGDDPPINPKLPFDLPIALSPKLAAKRNGTPLPPPLPQPSPWRRLVRRLRRTWSKAWRGLARFAFDTVYRTAVTLMSGFLITGWLNGWFERPAALPTTPPILEDPWKAEVKPE